MKYKNNKVSQNYTQNQSSIINKTSMLENSSINNNETKFTTFINKRPIKIIKRNRKIKTNKSAK